MSNSLPDRASFVPPRPQNNQPPLQPQQPQSNGPQFQQSQPGPVQQPPVGFPRQSLQQARQPFPQATQPVVQNHPPQQPPHPSISQPQSSVNQQQSRPPQQVQQPGPLVGYPTHQQPPVGYQQPQMGPPQQGIAPPPQQPQYPYAQQVQQPKQGKGKTVFIIILSAFTVILGSVALVTTMSSMAANSQLSDLEEENQRLQDAVDAKAAFNGTRDDLVAELSYFEGMPYKELLADYDTRLEWLIEDAYRDRYTPYKVEGHTGELQGYLAEVQELKNNFETQKATNSTGGAEEQQLDELSNGYVKVVYYRYADDKCNGEASGCVYTGSEPDVIYLNLDEKDKALRYGGTNLGTWWFNGILYHEYAHVLQGTNYTATAEVLGTFNNDYELMADCYAAVYYSADFPSYSYRKGCTDTQKQTIQDWVATITYTAPTV